MELPRTEVEVPFVAPGTADQGGAAARAAFATRFGYPADLVGRAPGRVNLIGEHTDYNQGLCLPIALPHATYAAVGRRTDDQVNIATEHGAALWQTTVGRLGPDQLRGWWSYVTGVLWAMGQDSASDQDDGLPGLDIFIHSTVPLGAGLSSSAALEASVAVAMWSLTGHDSAGMDPDGADRGRLVEYCIRAETEVAGAPTGGMDQCAAVLSAAGRALLIDFDEGSTEDVNLHLDGSGLELLVVDSGVSHALVDGGYAARRADCEAAAHTLGVPSLRQANLAQVATLTDERVRRRAHHVVSEIARVSEAVAALEERDYHRVGELFVQSHVSLRDDFEVSCAELETIVEGLLAAGALGARMTGGGFGGSAVALLATSAVRPACAEVLARFAEAGWNAPGFLRLSASEPAGLV